MTQRQKSRKNGQSSPRHGSASPTVEIFVRRGALRRFDSLKKRSTELPVTVQWDRRLGERRTASFSSDDAEGRTERRRQEPPFTWAVADFVVVEPPTPQRK